MSASTQKVKNAIWFWLSFASKVVRWSHTSLAELLKEQSLFGIGLRKPANSTSQLATPIRFCKLEARRVLNASFDLIGNNLILSGFDVGTHIDISHDSLTNSYQFNISAGSWFDSLGTNTGNNVLNVLDSVLTGSLTIDSALATNILLIGDLGSLDRMSMNTLGQVTDTPGTHLQTTTDLSIQASSILLGEQNTDNYQLGTLIINSSGAAEVHAVGNLIVESAITKGNLNIVADSLSLQLASSQSDIVIESRTGDIQAGSVAAINRITLISAGSILDMQDDAYVNFQAGETIDLRAAHHIASLGSDQFLEMADGSRVVATSHISGDVRIAGLGSLNLEHLSTRDGSITVQTQGTLRAIQVDSSRSDLDDNFIYLTASGTNSDLIVHRTVAGLFNADVTLIAARNILDGDMLADDVDIVGRNVSMKSQAGWIGGLAGSFSDIFHESYQASVSLEIIWSDHLLAQSSQSVILNPTLGSGSVELLAPTAILISNGDLNNRQIDTSRVTNLAIVADADMDGSGIAILSNGPSVAGDLLVQGEDIASTAPLSFHANRFLLVSGQAERFAVNNLNPKQSIQIDGQTTGTITALSSSDIRLIDLNSNGTSLQSAIGSVLVSSQGSIEVLGALVSNRDLLLHALEDIQISTELATTRGHITLSAGDDILINKSVQSTEGGTICIEASNLLADNASGIHMFGGTTIRTANSNVRISSSGEGNIQLQLVDVGSAAISLSAEGSIVGASQSHLLIAKELRIEADSNENGSGTIGRPNPTNGDPNVNELALQTNASSLAAKSANGLYIINDGGLTINSIAPVAVQCVTIDGKLDRLTDSSLSDLTSTHNGSIKLQIRDGDLLINDGNLGSQFGSDQSGVSGLGSGDVLLQALGANSDVIVNANVVSQAGAINVRASSSIEQRADLIVETSDDPVRNSILVEAENGSISMSSLAVSTIKDGNIAYTAANDILLSTLLAGQGSVFVNSGGSILDAHSDTVTSNSDGFSDLIGQPRQENVVAANASLLSIKGIGQAQNPLDISLGAIAASSSDSIYLLESNQLLVGAFQAFATTRIHINSTTSILSVSSLTGIQATDGHAKVESIQGSLSVDQSILAQQDVSLVAGGTEGGIAINAQIQAESGSISVLAMKVQQNSSLSTLSNDPITSSIYVRSTAGEISMNPTAQTISAGNILYDSATTINVGVLTSSSGIIHLNSAGSILDSQSDSISSLANGFAVPTDVIRQINLSASAVAITAGGDIGAAGNPLDTQIDATAILANGNIYIYETDAISIAQVAAASAFQIQLESTSTIRTSGRLSGVTSTTGHAKIETQNGPLDVLSAVSAANSVLLATGGTTGHIRIDANVSSTLGPIHLLAQQSIEQTADITANSGAASLSSSVLLEALDGAINASPTSRTSNQGGTIAYLASSDIVVGVLDAANGNLLLRAGGSILDSETGSVGHDVAGFAVVSGVRTENLLSHSAQLIAGGSIGAAGNPLDIKLDKIALKSEESSYILDTDALDIGTVGPISYTQVQLQSTTQNRTTPTLIGSQSGGHFKAENLLGDLNVTAAIRTAGDVQLATPGVLTIDASIASHAGALSLLAHSTIRQNANLLIEVSTGAVDNSVFVQSLSGAITMSMNATTQSNAGNIVYHSPMDIGLGRVLAPQGDISISAGGSLKDSQLDLVAFDGTTGFAINADQPRMENLVTISLAIRSAKVGSVNNPIDIDADVLAVDALGEVSLLESNRVEVGTALELQTKRIHMDSSHQVLKSADLSGILSRNGSITLQSVDGDIRISSRTDADGLSNGVSANQSVLLAAGGTGDLIIHSNVLSRTSDVWLAASGIVATPPTNLDTDHSATIQGDHLTIYAGVNAFLPNSIVNSVEARMTQALNTLAHDPVINRAADNAGTLILEDLQHGPTTTKLDLTTPQHPIGTDSFGAWRDHFRFTERFAEGFSLLVRNHNLLTIQAKNFVVPLSILGQAPAVYFETLSAPGDGLGASDLVITGHNELNSTRDVGDPGIVLIADGALQVRGSVDLLTPIVAAVAPKTQSINTLELFASAYHAGQGDPRFFNSASQNIPATTEYVVDPPRNNTEDYRTHVSQRVLAEFGSDQESGFLAMIHYADNAFQVFQSLGDTSRLVPGSDFVLQAGTIDLRAIPNTKDQATLFSRSTDFTTIDRFFLQNNRDLPTDLVIRRSLDFFLFSNAQSGEATEIIDHASYSQEIFDVKSLGTSSMGPITPIPDGIRPPAPPTRGDAGAIERPLALTLPEVELRQVKSEVVEVAIYQVSYDDHNHNGQVENAELPSFDSVLNRVDQDSKQPISSKNVGQSPTQGEIDEEKAKLLNSPDQPSGAYAIIRKNSDGKEEVLDVFSIRDWPESDEPENNSDEEMLPPNDPLPSEVKHETFQNDPGAQMNRVPVGREAGSASYEDHLNTRIELFEPQPIPAADEVPVANSYENRSRFENASALMTTLWLIQRQVVPDISPTSAPVHEFQQPLPAGFSATNRRHRKIKRLVRQITKQLEE